MRRISTVFFATAAGFALCGMVWGVVMAASQDFALAPAHGHLNLLGFVAMAIYGAYYALTPNAAGSRLARVHYGLAVATVLVMVPGIALAITGHGEAAAGIGSLLAIAAMALFGFMILRFGAGREGAGDLPPGRGAMPAE